MSMPTRAGAWIAIATVITLAYWDVWSFGFVNLDDQQYVYENPHVTGGVSVSNIRWAWTTNALANWHPLTWTSLQLDATLFGVRPRAFHIHNLILHCLNAILLYEFLVRVTGRCGCSVAAALLFAVHPVNVEAVAWISERKDLLSTLFGFLALRLYVECVFRDDWRFYWATAISLLFSLLSKQMLITLPCLLVVLDVWPLGRLTGRAVNGHEVQPCSVWRLVIEKAPLLVLTILFCSVAWDAQQSGGAIVALPWTERIGNSLLAYILYARDVFAPSTLAPFYPFIPGDPTMRIALWGTCVTGATVFAFVRRVQAPYLLTGWLWFLGVLVPVVGIVQVGNRFRADRYEYVPAVGLYIAIVWLAATLLRRCGATRMLAVTVTVCVTAVLMLMCFQQSRHWRSSLHLWTYAASVTPENYMTEAQLALSHLEADHPEQAEKRFLRSLALNPHYDNANQNYAALLFGQKRYLEAERHFAQAVRVSPQFAQAHLNLALTQWVLERHSDAEASFRKALDADPELALAHFWFGSMLGEIQRTAEARHHLTRALQLNPADRRTRRRLQKLADGQKAS